MEPLGVFTPGAEAPSRHTPAGLAAGAPLSRIQGPAEALALVAPELLQAEQELRGLVQTDVAAIPTVAGYLVDAGGKRIRPALTALGARAIGFEGPLSGLMCVGELLHLGSLLHDDVVDEAEMRRGRAAAHRIYGNAVAVLSGDFCLARAVLLAAEAGGARAVSELGRTVTEMAEGEVLQLQRAGDLSVGLDEYLDVVDRKSAALISWCVAAPAWAQESEPYADALYRFGRGIGVAFQITDDVLDYRPGTGKAPGADLRERKVTLPLLFAMDADPSLSTELQHSDSHPQALARLMERVTRTGALAAALDYARERVEESVAALDELPAGDGRDALQALGRYLVERAS